MAEMLTDGRQSDKVQIESMVDTMIKQLPKIRKKFGLTQEEFGEKIGMSRQTVSSIERGAVPLAWSTFLAIMQFLTVNGEDVRYSDYAGTYKYSDMLRKLLGVNRKAYGFMPERSNHKRKCTPRLIHAKRKVG